MTAKKLTLPRYLTGNPYSPVAHPAECISRNRKSTQVEGSIPRELGLKLRELYYETNIGLYY